MPTKVRLPPLMGKIPPAHQLNSISKRKMVGATGLEPATSCTPSMCATRLRHAPTAITGQRQSNPTSSRASRQQATENTTPYPALQATFARKPRTTSKICRRPDTARSRAPSRPSSSRSGTVGPFSRSSRNLWRRDLSTARAPSIENLSS